MLDLNNVSIMRAVRYLLATYAISKNAASTSVAQASYQLLKSDPASWTSADSDLWQKVVASQGAGLSAEHAGVWQPTALGVCVLVTAGLNSNAASFAQEVLSSAQQQNLGLALVSSFCQSGGAQGTVIPTDNVTTIVPVEPGLPPTTTTKPATPTTNYWLWGAVAAVGVGLFALATSGHPTRKSRS
jgi:hypothetical protein